MEFQTLLLTYFIITFKIVNNQNKKPSLSSVTVSIVFLYYLTNIQY